MDLALLNGIRILTCTEYTPRLKFSSITTQLQLFHTDYDQKRKVRVRGYAFDQFQSKIYYYMILV